MAADTKTTGATADGAAGRDKPLILIAEDVGVQVMLTTKWLEREGYEVAAAGDGEAALDLCRRLRPDLLLLDVEMPGRNGFQVLDELRQDRSCCDIPIVMLTAHAKDSVLFAEWATEADAFLTKPFDPRGLVETVARILKRPAASLPS